MQRKERLEDEFELANEEEAFGDYAHVAKVIAVNYSLIADELSLLGDFQKGSCLDIGFGLGDLALEVAKRYPQLEVIGIDISQRAAEEAARRAKEENLANVSFRVADAHGLAFGDNSLHLVVSHGVIHHLKDLAKVFSQIYRVLRPGGLAYLSDLRRDAPEGLVKGVAMDLPSSQGRAFLNSVDASYTPEELKSILAGLGIADFKVEGQRFSRQTIIKNIDKLRRAASRKADYNQLSQTVLIRK